MIHGGINGWVDGSLNQEQRVCGSLVRRFSELTDVSTHSRLCRASSGGSTPLPSSSLGLPEPVRPRRWCVLHRFLSLFADEPQVEAVLQLLQKYPSAHILVRSLSQSLSGCTSAECIQVCGASNPSADTLAMRLQSHLTPDELFRLNAPSRPFAEVRAELLPFCYVDAETNSFFLPPFM